MLSYINNFIAYQTLTFTGLYFFIGIICGYLIETIIIGIGKIIYLISKKSADLWLKKTIGHVILTFYSIWGLYNALIRIISNREITANITTIYEVIRTFSLFYFILRILLGLISFKSRKDDTAATSTSIVENVTKIIGYIVILFIILVQLGISITPILTALGVGSVAVALAFQDILSNLFSGVFVLASSQIKPGDFIKINTVNPPLEGFVVDITWRHTCIRQFVGNYVYVPNSKIASEIISNYKSPENEYILTVPFRVALNSNLEVVEKIAMDVAKEIQMFEPGAVKSYTPVIRPLEFDKSTINYIMYLKCVTFFDHYSIQGTCIKRLHEAFRKAGIEIPYEVTTIKQDSKIKKLF